MSGFWCIVVKRPDTIGYDVLPERFDGFDEAYELARAKRDETGREVDVDVAPEHSSPDYWDGND